MDKIRKRVTSVIPQYSIVPLIFGVLFNALVYNGSRVIVGEWRHYNIEGPLDQLIYFGCYVFWVVNYILIARQGKREACRLFSADFLSRVVCLVIFFVFPTTNTRPVVEPVGFWNQAMAFLYSIDAADNLFPSIHCLVSWFCYIGLRGKKEIPIWYRGFSCIFAILVFLSTLLTKQHVIWDVAGGVLLAEICFYIGGKPGIRGRYEKLLDKVNGMIFPEKGSD